jgi:hypothetical protein
LGKRKKAGGGRGYEENLSFFKVTSHPYQKFYRNKNPKIKPQTLKNLVKTKDLGKFKKKTLINKLLKVFQFPQAL